MLAEKPGHRDGRRRRVFTGQFFGIGSRDIVQNRGRARDRTTATTTARPRRSDFCVFVFLGRNLLRDFPRLSEFTKFDDEPVHTLDEFDEENEILFGHVVLVKLRDHFLRIAVDQDLEPV